MPVFIVLVPGFSQSSLLPPCRPVAGIGYSRLQTCPEFQKAMAKAQLEFLLLTKK